ncbi:hypothetical protein [Sphingobacterium spiritivorum]
MGWGFGSGFAAGRFETRGYHRARVGTSGDGDPAEVGSEADGCAVPPFSG